MGKKGAAATVASGKAAAVKEESSSAQDFTGEELRRRVYSRGFSALSFCSGVGKNEHSIHIVAFATHETASAFRGGKVKGLVTPLHSTSSGASQLAHTRCGWQR